jgi:chromosome segregation ATPase
MTEQELNKIERQLQNLDARAKRTDEEIEKLKQETAEALEKAEAVQRRLEVAAAG